MSELPHGRQEAGSEEMLVLQRRLTRLSGQLIKGRKAVADFLNPDSPMALYEIEFPEQTWPFDIWREVADSSLGDLVFDEQDRPEFSIEHLDSVFLSIRRRKDVQTVLDFNFGYIDTEGTPSVIQVLSLGATTRHAKLSIEGVYTECTDDVVLRPLGKKTAREPLPPKITEFLDIFERMATQPSH